MAQPNTALSPPEVHDGQAPEDTAAWREVAGLLRRAATLAAERGLDSELFMQAAWTACLDARPGLREKLEDKELRKELRRLRKRGLVGAA
jgi:hypothetical protein